MNTLTEQWLILNKACNDGIAFAKKHKLIGFPLDLVNEITEHDDIYASWLKNSIKNIIQYDKQGRVVYIKLIGDYKRWFSYDSDGIQHGREVTAAGLKYWFTCNKNGKIVHLTNNFRYEVTREYDDNDNLLLESHKSGFFIHNTYDNRNNLTFTTSSTKVWTENVYDDNNNLILSKFHDRMHLSYTYDDNNNLLTITNTNGIIIRFNSYDDRNNLIHQRLSSGEEIWYTYDEYNNVIYKKLLSGDEFTYVYEYYPDGQLKRYGDVYIPFFQK
jgi:YD repeat-containing protein